MMLWITTCPADRSRDIARRLVEEKLIACASIVAGVESVYRWKDEVEEAQEHLIVIKTRRELGPALAARLQELHPYEVPELIGFPIEEGLPAYLDWIREVTRDP